MPSQVDPPRFDSAWVVLTLTGELDMSRIDDLDQMAAEVLTSDKVNAVVDLSGVSFMDSSALRWLLNLQDRFDRAPGALRVAAPAGGSLARLLSLSGLEGRFAVFPTVAAATGSIDPIDKGHSFMPSHPARAADRKAV